MWLTKLVSWLSPPHSALCQYMLIFEDSPAYYLTRHSSTTIGEKRSKPRPWEPLTSGPSEVLVGWTRPLVGCHPYLRLGDATCLGSGSDLGRGSTHRPGQQNVRRPCWPGRSIPLRLQQKP